jgi:hypothetical protein
VAVRMPDDQLTSVEMEAIAVVVARLARGRGPWFDAEATAVRFGMVAVRESLEGGPPCVAALKVTLRLNRPRPTRGPNSSIDS